MSSLEVSMAMHSKGRIGAAVACSCGLHGRFTAAARVLALMPHRHNPVAASMTQTLSPSHRRVGVVSSAQTEWRDAWSGAQHIDLISAAVQQALEGSGLRIEDVDFIIDSGSDVLDGRSISNCGFLGAMGAHHKEESRVEDDGLWAALYGVTKIASGAADVGLIIAYAKPSEADVQQFHTSIADPFCQRPVGLDEATAQGLLAQAYLHRYHLEDDALAEVASRSWARALRNPHLRLSRAPDRAEVAASPWVAAPLRQGMLARPVDGAVAMVLGSERVARRAARTPIWVTGMGASMDSGNFAMREPGFAACATAARAAFAAAGTDARSIGLAEISATSAAAELITLEALGLAEGGRAIDLYRDDSTLELNRSGGALPAWPVFATGLVRLAEAASQMADGLGNGKGVVHASSGLGGQSHCVFVVEA